MPIKATCRCGKTLQAPDSYAGKTGKCPACGGPVDVPKGDEPLMEIVEPRATPASRPNNVGLWVAVAASLAMNVGLATVMLGGRKAESPSNETITADRILAREFVLVDKEGKTAARIGFNPNVQDAELPRIELYSQGDMRAAMQVQNEGWASLDIYDRAGRERASIAVHDAPPGSQLAFGDDKRATLKIVDQTQISGFQLEVSGDGKAMEVNLRDENKIHWQRSTTFAPIGQ